MNMLEAWEPLVSAAVTLIHLVLDRIPTTTLITEHTERRKESSLKKHRACLLSSFNICFPSDATMVVDLICVQNEHLRIHLAGKKSHSFQEHFLPLEAIQDNLCWFSVNSTRHANSLEHGSLQEECLPCLSLVWMVANTVI